MPAPEVGWRRVILGYTVKQGGSVPRTAGTRAPTGPSEGWQDRGFVAEVAGADILGSGFRRGEWRRGWAAIDLMEHGPWATKKIFRPSGC